MVQYIDKSALVAEIEKRIKEREEEEKKGWAYSRIKIVECEHILSFLNTLEVKEVDLEKEIGEYLSTYWPNEKVLHPFLGHMAKQFFELGIKAQKGKEV